MIPVIWHLGPRTAELAGRLAAALDAAAPCGPATTELVAAFMAGRPVVAVAATGIVVRLLAAHLADKRAEPPVVVVDEAGRFAVPLLGGHRGANDLARRLAAAIGAEPVVTTAGDTRFGVALDAPPPGWRLADPATAKAFMARLLEGAPCRLLDPLAAADWLRAGDLPFADDAALVLEVTALRRSSASNRLVYHPPVLALGIGCERDAPADALLALARATLAEAGLAPAAVAAVVSVDRKAAEQAIHALASALDVPARFFDRATLAAEAHRLATPSAAVEAELGIPGVAEAAALAAAGPAGRLLVPKRKGGRATAAIAMAPAPLDAGRIGRARGRLTVVGCGPGDAPTRTAALAPALARADLVIGYGLYLELVGDLIGGAERRAYPLGAERERCADAVAEAAGGREVVLVSSGDPGVYAMAALVMELLDKADDEAAQRIAVEVLPGVSALQVAAARAGAPLGHDFAVVSLSDLLTPLSVIEERLRHAAAGDFALALYNPVSQRRRTALATARTILLGHRPPSTPVVIARNLGRAAETVIHTTLGELAVDQVDMLSIVLVGCRQTRRFRRVDGSQAVYTPRGYTVE